MESRQSAALHYPGRRAAFSWCLFDWANSPLPTVIITFVFSAYFARGVVGNEVEGTVPEFRLLNCRAGSCRLGTDTGRYCRPDRAKKALACRVFGNRHPGGRVALVRPSEPGGCDACPNRCWAGAYRKRVRQYFLQRHAGPCRTA